MSRPASVSNSNFLQDTQDWLHESVQAFFATCNWEDQSIQVQEIRLSAFTDVDTSLGLSLSVGQFFAAVNWDGTFLTAPTSVAAVRQELPPETDVFTLSAFSDLF